MLKKLSNGYADLPIADPNNEEDIRDFLLFVREECNFRCNIEELTLDEMISILQQIAPKKCKVGLNSLGTIGFWIEPGRSQ